MAFVQLIILIALIQYVFFAAMTGRERGRSGLKAPATVGDEGFERMYRVQMNTLELLVAFVPAMMIAASHWSNSVVAALGAIYLIGRHLYWRSYVKDPASRSLGFALSILPILALLIMALVKVVIAVVS